MAESIPLSPRKKIERDEHDRPLSPRLKDSASKEKSKPRLFHKHSEENDDPLTNAMILEAIKLARKAVQAGNHPFGALLTNQKGEIILTAENRVNLPYPDLTAHAELELVRKASRELSKEDLHNAIMYTSTEPCAMCCGAICWSGIRKVVFACRGSTLKTYSGDGHIIEIPCQEILSKATTGIVVVGPINEEEAKKDHETYWKNLV